MKSILIDVTRCRGCAKCQEACAAENGLAPEPETARFARGELSEDRFTTLVPVGEGRFAKRQCLHCIDPSCAAACLVGALHRTKEGPVVYDRDKCIGCRYCMLACPFSIPRYEWDTTTPFVRKCEMCHDRPGGPACVEKCPHDALAYGDRDDLLREARARIAAAPDGYLDHVYGEEEGGGTAVLYLTDVPLEAIWPERLGTESVPEMTWPIVSATPWLFVGVATALGSLAFLVHRRDRLAEEKQAERREA